MESLSSVVLILMKCEESEGSDCLHKEGNLELQCELEEIMHSIMCGAYPLEVLFSNYLLHSMT